MFESFLKRTNWTDIVISIIFAFLGVLFIAKPTEMISAISMILGGILFIIGILKLVDYFTTKDKEDYLLTISLISVILGVIVLFCSDVIGGVFRIILGIWIIACGIRNFQTALVWKDIKSALWTVTLICSLLMIMAGTVVLVSNTLAFKMLGIMILVYALLDIIARVIFIKKINNYLDK